MYYFKKLNENYYIYAILIFVFIPINFIPQLFDGVFIEYAYETRDLGIVEVLYKEAGRYFHLFIIYICNKELCYSFFIFKGKPSLKQDLKIISIKKGYVQILKFGSCHDVQSAPS